MLTVSVAAGTADAGFELRNVSSTTCYLNGYVGVQMADSAGHLLPLAVRTMSGYPVSEPQQITLTAGSAPLNSGDSRGHAVLYIAWDDHCNASANDQPYNWLFTPPHANGAFTVRARVAEDPSAPVVICGNQVSVGPVEPPDAPNPG